MNTANACTCAAPAPAKTVQSATFRPDADILESGDAFTVIADLPGARSDAIDIQFEKGVLTLRAEVQPRQPQNTRFLAREYGVGAYERTFRVGEGIDTENISAELKQGVLTLRLPKAAAARSRRIEVRAS